MDWTAAKSYYIGYRSIDRFDTIIFSYNYFSTLSLGFEGSGEPNLSILTCRFVVYISTFAKPMGLYLTFLFSIERIFTKILRQTNYRILFKRIYLFLIALTMILIFAIKLYEIIKWIPNEKLTTNSQKISHGDSIIDYDDDDDDQSIKNSTDEILNFRYCYRTMNIETYRRILSFYLVQYCYRTFSNTSLNSQFYISLSLCVGLFELILQCLHSIVDAEENNNSDIQVNYLQTMIFIYNLRSICLPIIICLITRNSCKEWIYDLFISRSYLNEFNETDQLNSTIDQTELVLSSLDTSEKDHFDT